MVTVDEVAELIYNTPRRRSVPWSELSEVGWKADYRKKARAVIELLTGEAEVRISGAQN